MLLNLVLIRGSFCLTRECVRILSLRLAFIPSNSFSVNTFTEHHGGAWSHKDLQHTTLGVLCERPQRSSSNWFTLRPALLTYIMVGWTGGALGILLSRRKTRNIIPSIMLVVIY